MDIGQKMMSTIKTEIYDYLIVEKSFSENKLLYFLEKLLQKELNAQLVTFKLKDEENFNNERLFKSEKEKLILSLREDETVIGTVHIYFYEKMKFTHSFLHELSAELFKLLTKINSSDFSTRSEKRYEQLYSVTSLFHSSMEVETVLNEIFKTLREIYEDFSYYLLLTSDYENLQHLPVKNLEMDTTNETAWQAYVSGEVQTVDSISERRSLVYIPLKGKQGVYGVLQIISLNSMIFPKEELKFLVLLANTAGTAFENAQLYQQSRQLISDLKLINETSHQLNTNLRLNEVTTYMRENIINSFQAKEVGFCTFQRANEEIEILEGSTDFFKHSLSSSFKDYIRKYTLRTMEPLFVGDLRTFDEFDDIQFCSCMLIPMDLTNGKIGACVVVHPLPYFFTFDQFKLLQSLIHHSTLAFSNSILREELEKYVITDYLTKLYSRKYLDDKIKLSMKHDSFGTFILLDIDDFKLVNDQYGHQIGDEILIQVGSVIKDNLRDTDIGARWGGEELAIYLPKIDLSLGLQIADRIKKRVSEHTSPSVTVSCGVSFWQKEKNDSAKELFLRADTALYKAKGQGKNKVSAG
ncbi:sensor domain-containing diguanylate cyclase [Sutcliffiella cohnii]